MKSGALVLAGGVWAALALAGCGGGTPSVPAVSGTPSQGQATRIEGTVEIQKTPGSEWQALAPSDDVPTGARVRTGPDGEADVRLADKAAVRLKPGTEIEIAQNRVENGASRIEVKLESGRLLHRFDHMMRGAEYRVTTPNAGAAIRGTQFDVEAAGDQTAVRCLKGAVEVGNEAGRIQLDERQGTRVRRGEAPQTPSQLVQKEVEALMECSVLNFQVMIKRVHRVATIAEMRALVDPIEAWGASHDGKYPATLAEAGLASMTDDWNTPFRYEVHPDGTGYTIYSNGPDHDANTDDDLEYRRD